MPYNGDVFVRSKSDTPAGGHVFMVVAGHPREGNEDEIVTDSSTISGWSAGTDVVSYRDEYGETYNFVPRTEEPEPTNPYYDQECGVTANGSYAWGRFSEICKSACDLCKMEPKKWYPYKEDSYQRTVVPSLGSVMCFTNLYDIEAPGFVCIVEQVEPDQIYVSLITLEEKFEYKAFKKHDGSWDMDLDGDGKYELQFQGFICNPAVSIQSHAESAKDKFVSIAVEQDGTDGSFTEQQTGMLTQNSGWSAAFVSAVAKKAGSLLNVIIPNTFSCSDIGKVGVIRNMGIWLDGPTESKCPEPKVGDIALFRTTDNLTRSNRYAADKAGIIVEVGQASSTAFGTNETIAYDFYAIIGDCDNKVQKRQYSSNSGLLSGIFRPRWEQVDGTTGSLSRYSNIEGLYTEGTTLEDAAIRDLRYVNLTDNGFEPSINSKGLKLCAINYTGLLANLYSTFAEVGSSSATDANLVVDLWNNSVKSVFQDDEYSMVSLVSDSVASDTEDGQYVVNDSTINPGGSVEAESTVDVFDAASTSIESNDLDVSLDVTATFNEVKITKTITLTNTVRSIYTLLNAELDNPAATIGVMANMFQESEFMLDSVDEETRSCGLIHWAGSRLASMKYYCRQHGNSMEWIQNLEGQIGFIFNESVLDHTLKRGMDSIRKVNKGVDGSVRATRIFLDYFILGGPSQQGQIKEVEQYNIRAGWAKGLWSLFFGGMKQK